MTDQYTGQTKVVCPEEQPSCEIEEIFNPLTGGYEQKKICDASGLTHDEIQAKTASGQCKYVELWDHYEGKLAKKLICDVNSAGSP